jgi:hypothetical protein
MLSFLSSSVQRVPSRPAGPTGPELGGRSARGLMCVGLLGAAASRGAGCVTPDTAESSLAGRLLAAVSSAAPGPAVLGHAGARHHCHDRAEAQCLPLCLPISRPSSSGGSVALTEAGRVTMLARHAADSTDWSAVSGWFGVGRVPVSARGDRAGGALVSALRPVYRDVEELLAERGIRVDHVTVHRWVRRFSPLLVDAARFGRHRVGSGTAGTWTRPT